MVVQNKNTPIHILEKLANDENSSVRSVLASCYNDTPIYILEKLANDQDSHVRRAIANHQNTPIHILEKLAEDNFAIVRLSIANNPNINQKIIKLLFEHKNYNLNDKDPQEIEAAIELEIKRLNWTEKRARKWIEEKLGQIEIYDLSREQLFEFWQYLKSIESNSYPKSLRKDVFYSDICFLDDIPF